MSVLTANKVSVFPISQREVAWKLVGGLSKPSKMPCYGYSLPATACKTGSELRKIENSVCSKCYAHKGMYVFPNVKKALARRLRAIRRNGWVDAMVFLLHNQKKSNHFRWHDSGDIQSISHFKKIIEVCNRTPHIQHWIPTHEHKLIKDAEKQGIKIPANLTIRLSSCMIDAPVRVKDLGKHCGSSTFIKVLSDTRLKVERPCTAYKRGGKCLTCRLCWDKKIKAVSYKLH